MLYVRYVLLKSVKHICKRRIHTLVIEDFMIVRVQLNKKNSAHEPQGACHQDELIVGRLPVVK
jgi:hypothetical protein